MLRLPIWKDWVREVNTTVRCSCAACRWNALEHCWCQGTRASSQAYRWPAKSARVQAADQAPDFFLSSCACWLIIDSHRCYVGMFGCSDVGTMMMTFITQGGEGQGKTNKKRKATKSKGRGLEEGASRALMRQVEEEGCGVFSIDGGLY